MMKESTKGFVKAFLKNHKNIGAIAPSSKALATVIVGAAGLDSKHCVVELGPGMGSFTGEILKALALDTSFFCIEP